MPDETRTAATPAATPPVVAPPPGNPRFPHVDALRAIAALAVLVYHCGFTTSAIANPVYGAYVGRGESGVALFFLISGFLLYRPFVATRLLGAPSMRLRDYAWRRLLRIVPAYWLALTVLAIWPGLTGVFSKDWWIYYGFGQIYSAHTLVNGISPAWTLCVEVTFYALLPFYAALIARVVRRAQPRHQVRLELVLLGLVFLAVTWWRHHLYAANPFDWALETLPAELDWFAVGMAIAVLSVELARTGANPRPVRVIARAPWLPWLGAVVAYWAVSRLIGGPHRIAFGDGEVALLYNGDEDLAVHLLYAVVAAGMLLPAVFGTDGGGWVRAILRWRPLAWLGLISYGIYLWHEPLLLDACQPRGVGAVTVCRFHGVAALRHAPFPSLLVIAFVVSVACAAASYVIVERPALRLKNGLPRRARREPRAVA